MNAGARRMEEYSGVPQHGNDNLQSEQQNVCWTAAV